MARYHSDKSNRPNYKSNAKGDSAPRSVDSTARGYGNMPEGAWTSPYPAYPGYMPDDLQWGLASQDKQISEDHSKMMKHRKLSKQ